MKYILNQTKQAVDNLMFATTQLWKETHQNNKACLSAILGHYRVDMFIINLVNYAFLDKLETDRHIIYQKICLFCVTMIWAVMYVGIL